jgi:hypothetical protein
VYITLKTCMEVQTAQSSWTCCMSFFLPYLLQKCTMLQCFLWSLRLGRRWTLHLSRHVFVLSIFSFVLFNCYVPFIFHIILILVFCFFIFYSSQCLKNLSLSLSHMWTCNQDVCLYKLEQRESNCLRTIWSALKMY